MTANTPGGGSFRGSTVDSGQWNGSGTISSNAATFSGSITLAGTTSYSGSLSGRFFGPAANEVGAAFNYSVDVGAGSRASYAGVTVGKKN